MTSLIITVIGEVYCLLKVILDLDRYTNDDIGSYILTYALKLSLNAQTSVQWLSCDIYILEPVFLLRVRIPEFLFSFFFFFLLLQWTVWFTSRCNKQWRIQKGFRTDYFIFIGIFKKNERSSANGTKRRTLCMSIFQALQENQWKARVLTTHEGFSRC